MPDLTLVLIAILAILGVIAIRAAFDRVTIYEFQQGLRYRNGHFERLVGPGAHIVYRPTTSIRVVDARLSVDFVLGQEVVTSDGISVRISLAFERRIVDPVAAAHEVEDYRAAVYSALQVALREVVSALPIDDLLAQREEVGARVHERSTEAARRVGVELVSVAVRDLMFPGPMKRLFAQVVEARQQGLAALEKARGETAALRSLANAAKMVEANPALVQLRMLQQLESTSGNMVVLGMPSAGTPVIVQAPPASKRASPGPADEE